MLVVNMARSIHEYVIQSLNGADLDAVHAGTKVPKSTLRKIRARWIANPGIQSIEPIFFYFKDREGRALRRRMT